MATYTPGGGKGLARLLHSDLKDFIQQQKKLFESSASTDNQDHESDDEAPPQTDTTGHVHVEPKASFVPSGRCQRPSDYIVHLAKEFEAGNTTLPGKKKKKKKLTRDQVLFLIGFADACNTVWQQECDNIPMEDRKEYAFLLMGQGGSGKTAIVQELSLIHI